MFRIFVLCCCLPLALNAQEKPPIVVGFAHFVPYNYLNAQGEPVGYFLDRVAAAVRASGYRFIAKFYPPKRGFVLIQRGELDMLLCLGRNNYEILGDSVSYSSTPVGRLSLRVYGLAVQKKVTGKQDLLGYNLAFRTGYSYGGLRSWLMQNKGDAHYIDTRSTAQGLRLINAQRSDYFLEYQHAVDFLSAQMRKTPPPSTVLNQVTTYLVYSRHHNDGPLQQQIEAAQEQLSSATH